MSYIPLIARVESLPPLPESILQIESLFAQGDPDIDAIVKIIESDPVLTAEVLSKVNAPFYGFSKSIVSILQAVTLFGSTQIRSIVLSSTLERSFDIDLSPYDITTAKFSQISIMQSELIFQWYMGIDITIARAITPIAFLMETGKVLIAKEVVEAGKVEAFKSDFYMYEDISYSENKYALMTSAEVNSLIFDHLNLSTIFGETMRYLDMDHTVPKHLKEMVEALRIVRAAVNIKEQLSQDSMQKAKELLQKDNYNIATFERAAKRVSQKYMESL